MPPKQLKLLVVAAARPNFMKVAPLIRRIQKRQRTGQDAIDVDCRLVHTGQHYDSNMSDVFFTELGIRPPDINLAVGPGSHAVQTAAVMTKFEPVCARERPDWTLVVGDVNSTMACALVCAKMGLRVAHVEAGLRSFDRSMPEEVNRVVTDAVADLLLTPSTDADENLRREGVPDSRIRFVGNIMIDALVDNLTQARARPILGALGLQIRKFVYVTLHRPSNVDERESLTAIIAALRAVAATIPVVFPMHPRTRKMCQTFGIPIDAGGCLRVLEPVGYHDSLALTENAALVVTDSGGLQEESTFFRVPCLTLRPSTERPVTITMGTNRLVNVENLYSEVTRVLECGAVSGQVPPLWDGRTSERILNHLLSTH
jgi:UDP-N-acetylglucosamine 2-epimerase (non-hydrolysing)